MFLPRHKVTIANYEPYIGAEAVDRIQRKAERLEDIRVVNVNSTYYGGGVAELLSSTTILLNNLGIRTGWRVLQGSPDFFGITKKMHNALQGGDIRLTELKTQIYEEVVHENAIRNHLDHDIVIIHDPQPLPLIRHYRKHGPWIWRCHVDLSSPNRELWGYLRAFVESYDAVIVSIRDYMQEPRHERRGGRREARALRDPDGPPARGPDQPVRPVEGPRGRDPCLPAGAEECERPAGPPRRPRDG
jgi:trehalose synthase